ncbi:MAG: Lrp/AsnC family transcriptional regulator [Gammaproteobacteria bacterium]|nr:Lrp/AsnC family transcriptional regulator [Gammaproteobacteria bacterium]MBU1646401.1 Lrp/AsnC family transcriptional regulator [Gammaproteobacteria bacterium]MBU1970944.1 Lrp/AsnC family transcriptional regulator [Gammaproteobacteria bacterium]
MDSPYSPLEFSLLNAWQRDFPLVSRPFAAIGEKVGAGETAVIETLARLHQRGAVSRVGAVFAPRRIGASTLAALAAPPDRLEEVAELVSQRPEVNHNYQREHHYNLWFVATAPDSLHLEATLEDIARETGCPVMSLPLQEEFHIDLGFDLAGKDGKSARMAHPCLGNEPSQATPSAADQKLMAALQPGLDLVAQPFAALAARVGLPEAGVIERIAGWLDNGIVKRFGVVVRHHELGYRANAMTVFDVPDALVSEVGQRLAREDGVTLCYRRARHLPEWPYNLYCMVHGRSREEVLPVIERLCRIAGYPCEALFSLRRFKQCGARYFVAPATAA